LAFMALNLPEGSEVITPAFSYAAVAEVLHLMRLKPVYCEVSSETYLMDVSHMASLIGPQTRAIAPVHLYGQCCDMENILRIAQENNLFVVEDTAQAIGAYYTFNDGSRAQAGTMGHIGTTSFFPSKNLGCYGDGGAVFTNDAALAKRIRMAANHGQVQKYAHEIIGINSRLDTLQAAILNVKLAHLQEFEQRRNQVADAYDRALDGQTEIKIPRRADNSTHVFHQYTLRMNSQERRDGLMEHLKGHGIPSMVYYPLPLYRQKAYEDNTQLAATEALCGLVISLPIHTEMDNDQIEFITQKVLRFLN
jgi:UDP-2-acetamido-2-deoxy-ribo-hexuluronate aminotransferase